jgi:hypothetical protein
MQSISLAIFACCAEPKLQEHEVATLLKQSRVANRKYDVTGMLLYLGGSFLQSFEGEASKIDTVCGSLYRDKPRMRINQLVRETIAERQFAEWTMGFAAVDPAEAGELLGDPSLFQSPSMVTRIDAEGAKTLISIFGQRRYQADRSGMFKAIRRPA